ncbi:MAG: hypothetical protein HQL87_15990 [Magnetococcales bacterium]|nr:hypothetical protein [Magnetococcales bacterium]
MSRDHAGLEIDLFVVTTEAVALVEVKSKLTTEGVREHLTHPSECQGFFPEHADKRPQGRSLAWRSRKT